MKDLTLVLITCGEETESECLASIEPFRSHVEFLEIRNVFPQSKALNQMIDGVKTEFFIPIDADMVLDPDAWSRVRNSIDRHRHNENWHSILFPLWDTLTEKKILALKIIRSKIAKENLFSETATPDVEHYRRLTTNGFSCIHDYLKQKPIGKHIVRGHHFCYNKYKDVYQTYRSNNFEWDEGVFMGGNDLRTRAKAHFDYFVLRWLTTENIDYLSCIAGLIDGVTSPLSNRSKDLSKKEYLIPNEKAIGKFLDWWMKPFQSSAAVLF